MKIYLLGSPEVVFDRQPISFPTQKALALLIYLAVEGGMHGRDRLMTLLWPEREAEKANVTLRTTLSRLRKSLIPAGEFLISQGGKVGFDFSKSSDIDLARLAASAQPEIAPDELRIILTLDRGEFLEGFTLPDAPDFDTWAATRREACQRQLETVYDRLSQHLLAIHDSAGAVETAARWVARAPLSEQAYRRLMAAQALSGQRPAALQTYRQLQATLQQELDLKPGRETALLADNIGRGRVEEERADPSAVGSSGPAGEAEQRLTLP
ncbi:MAG: BTAD domain-containing putative transcriptional regulator, partial [Anaerolineales bacterium]|nr:BTAD domain-containing putative transcriptional regulator [Anaerolineales bacterium]